MPLLREAKKSYKYTVDFGSSPTFVTDSWDTAMKEASKGIDKDKNQWIDVIDNTTAQIKWKYRGTRKNPGRVAKSSFTKNMGAIKGDLYLVSVVVKEAEKVIVDYSDLILGVTQVQVFLKDVTKAFSRGYQKGTMIHVMVEDDNSKELIFDGWHFKGKGWKVKFDEYGLFAGKNKARRNPDDAVVELAERVGADPEDPEFRFGAYVYAMNYHKGQWSVEYQAMNEIDANMRDAHIKAIENVRYDKNDEWEMPRYWYQQLKKKSKTRK